MMKLPGIEEIREAADEYVFEENGHRWSNNNNECGDNFASFISGAKWVIKKVKERPFIHDRTEI